MIIAMISPRRLSSPPASSSTISNTASEMIDFQVSGFKSDAKVRPTLPSSSCHRPRMSPASDSGFLTDSSSTPSSNAIVRSPSLVASWKHASGGRRKRHPHAAAREVENFPWGVRSTRRFAVTRQLCVGFSVVCASSKERSSACAPGSSLLDHLVSARKQGRWQIEIQCPGGGDVDRELELGRIHNRQVSRPFALENPAAIDANLVLKIGRAHVYTPVN